VNALRWIAYCLVGLLLCCGLGVLAFDALVVRPAQLQIEAVIADAAPSERNPPRVVLDMVHRAHGDRLPYLVARYVSLALPDQIDGTSQLHRQLKVLGIALLLPVHLSDHQIVAAYLSRAYMGPGVRGFARASERYLNVPLDSLDAAQAAKLVAIAYAPSAYLDSPERLERRTQYLLSLSPQ